MAKSIEARLLSTRGPGKEAILEIDGSSYTVRDGLSWSADQAPAIGDIFDVELSATLDEDEAWDEKFCGNPEHRIGLESTGGWSYRAKGRITSIDPVCVDCG